MPYSVRDRIVLDHISSIYLIKNFIVMN
jgi:hypothetical protein